MTSKLGTFNSYQMRVRFNSYAGCSTQILMTQGRLKKPIKKALACKGRFYSWLTTRYSTRTTALGLKPKSATLPFLARAALALFKLRISSVSSRTLPPRPMPSMRTLRV